MRFAPWNVNGISLALNCQLEEFADPSVPFLSGQESRRSDFSFRVFADRPINTIQNLLEASGIALHCLMDDRKGKCPSPLLVLLSKHLSEVPSNANRAFRTATRVAGLTRLERSPSHALTLLSR